MAAVLMPTSRAASRLAAVASIALPISVRSKNEPQRDDDQRARRQAPRGSAAGSSRRPIGSGSSPENAGS